MVQRNNPGMYAQWTQPDPENFFNIGLSSDERKVQMDEQKKFAAQALGQVQLEDEDAEFMMLEQVSKTNTVSFGVDKLSPRRQNYVQTQMRYDTRQIDRPAQNQRMKVPPIFTRSYKDEMLMEAEEDDAFEQVKTRQKFLAQSLQMEVRNRQTGNLEKGNLVNRELPKQFLPDTRHQQTLYQSQQEQFLSLDHFLSKKTEDQGQNPNESQQYYEPQRVNMTDRSERRREEPARVEFQNMRSPRMGVSTSKFEVDKDEMRKRQQAIEMKRKQEIEDLKRKARQKEEARKVKLKAVVCIQRWVRGHLVRSQLKRQQANFKFMRRFRRMMSVALGRRRKVTLRRLKQAMREAGKYVADQKLIIFEKYLAHCAVMIQKHWKGWMARNVLYPKQKMMVKRRQAEKQRELRQRDMMVQKKVTGQTPKAKRKIEPSQWSPVVEMKDRVAPSRETFGFETQVDSPPLFGRKETQWTEHERSIGSVDESMAGNLMEVCNEIKEVAWPSQKQEPDWLNRPVGVKQEQAQPDWLSKPFAQKQEQTNVQSKPVVPKQEQIKPAESKKVVQQQSNIDDMPVGVNHEEQEVKVPSYNFEAMIQQALQSQPDPKQLLKTQNSQKQDKVEKAEKPEKGEEEVKELTDAQKRKAELLARRKKYDPRAALKAKPKENSEAATLEAKPEPEAKPITEAKQLKEVKPMVETKPVQVASTEAKSKQVEKSPIRPKQKVTPEEIKQPPKPQALAKPEPAEPKPEPKPSDSNENSKPKPFLKRKTQNLKGGKVNWNVKSRTDCWSGPAKVKEQAPSTAKEQPKVEQPHPVPKTEKLAQKQRPQTTRHLQVNLMEELEETQPTSLQIHHQLSQQMLQAPISLQPTNPGLPRPHSSYHKTPTIAINVADPPTDDTTDHGTVSIQLEELQKVYELFHTDLQIVNVEPRLIKMGHPPTIQKRVRKEHNFREVQIQDRVGVDTWIPHLDRSSSLFFTSYNDDKFESVFEDLKNHYQQLCEEEPDRSFEGSDMD